MQALSSALGLGPLAYSARQFTLFRVIFGTYLLLHFLMLIPYGPELFSSSGVIADPSLQASYRIFPNLLVWCDSPLGTQVFLGVLALLALAYLCEWQRPLVAVALWYGWACLFNRNIFIGNPGLPFVGWLLLASALIPALPSRDQDTDDRPWAMPPPLFWGAWFIMALGYTVSGLHKLGSPSWADGTALRRLLENPLARDVPWREALLAAPDWVLQAQCYGSLALEIAFLPLALLRWTRPWVWLAMVAMHAGILSLVSFADLTFGVLMVHLFTIDARWLPARRRRREDSELILFFDGVCGLCNAAVDFVLAEDRQGRFRFSPLQGSLAAERLSAQQVANLQSLVVIDDGEVLEKSAAVLRIADHLGGLWRLATVFILVPRPLRDAVYAWIARNRYRWFGKKETCRLPTYEERARFV